MGEPSRGKRASLTIGTRGSRLALWQAEWIQTQLHTIAPDIAVTLKRIRTSGDKILDVPLANLGGKGLFVKEIEESLLRGDIDLAVHSMKDVPTMLPEGLGILAMPPREDPRDALVSQSGCSFRQLPAGATVGTSSLRRQAQLLHHRPDLKVVMLRGNLDTRLRKLQEKEFDAVVLAAAGLRRMGWADHVTEWLPQTICVPAIGQGAIGVEGRLNDGFVLEMLENLNDSTTYTAVKTERAFLERLEGGCQVPIGAHASISGETLVLEGLIASVDGTRVIRGTVEGTVAEPGQLGIQLAERLLKQGGKDILSEIYGKSLPS